MAKDCLGKKRKSVFIIVDGIPADVIELQSTKDYIPSTNRKQITENGQKITSAKGIKFLKTDGDYVVYEVRLGSYSFQSTGKI